MDLTFKPTDRGSLRADFLDYYEKECSLQSSSLAYPAAIWLGVTDAEVKRLDAEGWQDVPLPVGASVFSRMHLTQDQVLTLLPALSHFAATGCLPRDGESSNEVAPLVARIKELEAELSRLRRGVGTLARLAGIEVADDEVGED